MDSPPNLYCIHASDTSQHLEKIRQLSQKFKAEARIADFIPLSTDDDQSSLSERFRSNDILVLLLTYGLELRRKDITKLIFKVKNKFPDSVIVEIIIDNIPFTNDYITLPKSLRPIRDELAAWIEIEEKLKQILPTVSPINWLKYLKYATVLIVILIALFKWSPWKKTMTAIFKTDKVECEVPCTIKFTSTSANADKLEWDFGDGQKSAEENPIHIFLDSGKFTVSLNASGEGESKQHSQTITVSKPVDSERIVHSVSSTVINPNFSGNCPFEYLFGGTIEVNKPGMIKYNWIRSDGLNTADESLDFAEPGIKEIHYTWNLGEVGEEYKNYWLQLKVTAPNETGVLSDKSVFNLRCTTVFGEDCLLFDYQNVTIDSSSRSANPSTKVYRIKEGNTFLQWITSRKKAELAIKAIKEYRFDKKCWIEYPSKGLSYFTSKGDIPSGRLEGDSCIRIYNSENLTTREKSQTSFEILDGNRVVLNAKSQSDANKILKIFNHYKPRYVCYVDGYNMMYIRK